MTDLMDFIYRLNDHGIEFPEGYKIGVPVSMINKWIIQMPTNRMVTINIGDSFEFMGRKCVAISDKLTLFLTIPLINLF